MINNSITKYPIAKLLQSEWDSGLPRDSPNGQDKQNK